ncbi:hypothetical protein VP01_772g4 [Puccinia sorghi]|uniref:5'-3' exoribonuclease 1 D1 domain-containing protein n=1 Tax=Puccinia sorghi TaxID=27349 RepID=A0A0L6UCC1_9BASI|nr:hypothetical protein VP01_772g4 [Puccinia sorghi]
MACSSRGGLLHTPIRNLWFDCRRVESLQPLFLRPASAWPMKTPQHSKNLKGTKVEDVANLLLGSQFYVGYPFFWEAKVMAILESLFK